MKLVGKCPNPNYTPKHIDNAPRKTHLKENSFSKPINIRVHEVYLEDHPTGCKWLMTMVSCFLLSICCSPSKLHKWLTRGVTNHFRPNLDDPPWSPIRWTWCIMMYLIEILSYHVISPLLSQYDQLFFLHNNLDFSRISWKTPIWSFVSPPNLPLKGWGPDFGRYQLGKIHVFQMRRMYGHIQWEMAG